MLCKHGGDKAGIHAVGKKPLLSIVERSEQSWLSAKKQMQEIRVGSSQGGKRTKTTKPLTRFCQLCLKFSHRTVDCWVQEKNKEYCP